jgi:hypothetical protein
LSHTAQGGLAIVVRAAEAASDHWVTPLTDPSVRPGDERNGVDLGDRVVCREALLIFSLPRHPTRGTMRKNRGQTGDARSVADAM